MRASKRLATNQLTQDTIQKVCAAHLASTAKTESAAPAPADVDAAAQSVGQFGSCVAVLDPPREGVHWKVIQALRAAKEIERIVYVSCNHTAWVDQARALCCPGNFQLLVYMLY